MNTAIIIQELRFKAVRSSGPGGQHVNKVSSKVIASLDVINSNGLSSEEKLLLKEKLKNRLSSEGVISVSSSTSRSQFRNKDLTIKKILELLRSNLVKPKFRKRTKPSRQSKEKRLKLKKIHALKKSNRQKPKLD